MTFVTGSITAENFSAYTLEHWNEWREGARELLDADVLTPDPGRGHYRTDPSEPLLLGAREEYGLMQLNGHTMKYHLWCELLRVEPHPRLIFQVWQDETWKSVFMMTSPSGPLSAFYWINEQALPQDD